MFWFFLVTLTPPKRKGYLLWHSVICVHNSNFVLCLGTKWSGKRTLASFIANYVAPQTRPSSHAEVECHAGEVASFVQWWCPCLETCPLRVELWRASISSPPKTIRNTYKIISAPLANNETGARIPHYIHTFLPSWVCWLADERSEDFACTFSGDLRWVARFESFWKKWAKLVRAKSNHLQAGSSKSMCTAVSWSRWGLIQDLLGSFGLFWVGDSAPGRIWGTLNFGVLEVKISNL